MVNVPELKRGVLDSVVDAIGNTPIIKLNNLTKDLDAEVDVKWKLSIQQVVLKIVLLLQ